MFSLSQISDSWLCQEVLQGCMWLCMCALLGFVLSRTGCAQLVPNLHDICTCVRLLWFIWGVNAEDRLCINPANLHREAELPLWMVSSQCWL